MAADGSAARWLLNKTNPEYVDYIARLASVSPTCAQVLINRGMKTPERLDAFLQPRLDKLTDPFTLPGLRDAVERIRAARQRGERVLIHGDYDADGVTATAIMVEALTTLGIEVHYFIPHRLKHGYGFGSAGVARARELGATLIITVDCGITSFEAVAAARALGIDVIITDHHEPARQRLEGTAPSGDGECRLPAAAAVINPKLPGAPPTACFLAGAGVAFMLCLGLFDGNGDDTRPLLDLAALGTGADVVPVLDDNRILLKTGIKILHRGDRLGIRALKDAAGMRPDSFRLSSLHFGLVPRINAAGRIDDAGWVVRLLTTRSDAEAEELARWLNSLNQRRQEIEEGVYREALAMLQAMDRLPEALVLAGEGWHPGVVGIVAAKLTEKFCRPTVVLSLEDGVAKGSGRSIPAFDIHRGLSRCSGLLSRFGGHRQAAGLALPAENLEPFRTMLAEAVRAALAEDDFVPVLNLDAAVGLAEVTVGLVDEFSRLEPFGCGNDEPLLGARGLEVLQPRVVGNKHLKMKLRQNGCRVDSIGFDFGSLIDTIGDRSRVDVAFCPTINEWDGSRFLQLQLKALRPA